jgi:hypothetical protein
MAGRLGRDGQESELEVHYRSRRSRLFGHQDSSSALCASISIEPRTFRELSWGCSISEIGLTEHVSTKRARRRGILSLKDVPENLYRREALGGLVDSVRQAVA